MPDITRSQVLIIDKKKRYVQHIINSGLDDVNIIVALRNPISSAYNPQYD